MFDGKLSNEERQLLKGTIGMIQIEMESNDEVTYFDDGHPNRMYDPDNENYDDSDWELEPKWENRNGAKIIKILERILYE